MAWEEGVQVFGEYLYRLIEDRGHSIRGFAPRLHVSHSMLSHIRQGLTPPPQKRMEQWADAFDLQGKDREYFLDLAALACAPARVLRMFEVAHPAHQSIRLAAEKEMLSRLHVAETGVPYVPRKSRRKSPGSQR